MTVVEACVWLGRVCGSTARGVFQAVLAVLSMTWEWRALFSTSLDARDSEALPNL